jgi:CheY-like chemotaxis protein
MRNDKKEYRILCLDDDAATLAAHKCILESHGYEVLTAQSSKEALEIMLREPIDLLIQDIARPGINGIELCGVMKSDERLRGIPAVVCSGHEGNRNRLLGQCPEVAAVLGKPFEVNLLLGVVRKALQSGGTPR